jgi:hypothetical protein
MMHTGIPRFGTRMAQTQRSGTSTHLYLTASSASEPLAFIAKLHQSAPLELDPKWLGQANGTLDAA